MNQEIQQATLSLAQLLLESQEYTTMQQAEEVALQDDVMQAQYSEYAQLRGELQQLTQEDAPDDEKIIALQDDIERLQGTLNTMDNMVALNQARGAFDRMMNDVNSLLAGVLAPQEETEEDMAGCGSGGCAGCSGCGSR